MPASTTKDLLGETADHLSIEQTALGQVLFYHPIRQCSHGGSNALLGLYRLGTRPRKETNEVRLNKRLFRAVC